MNAGINIGDRVEVTNLRDGTTHPGTVESFPQSDRASIVVAMDHGVRIRVGIGFVRKIEAQA